MVCCSIALRLWSDACALRGRDEAMRRALLMSLAVHERECGVCSRKYN